MSNFSYDPHFIKFKDSLESLLTSATSTNNTSKDEFTKKQKKMVESLVKEERKFRRILKKNPLGPKVYEAFVNHILVEKKNILAARPYFRERQTDFAKNVSPAIKAKNIKKLMTFDINYPFIAFVLQAEQWPESGFIQKQAKIVKKIREEIILQNTPLAISRATLFKKKTPENHLAFMDLNQIAFEGLINAVDKFVLPYTPVYRSVIIGRISGDLIENYSETPIHYWPNDKRKIYRANKISKGIIEEDTNYERLANEVNTKGPELDRPTDGADLQYLVASLSHVSLDYTDENHAGKKTSLSDTMAAPEMDQPDVRVEDLETKAMLLACVKNLSVLELKILKMKGYSL